MPRIIILSGIPCSGKSTFAWRQGILIISRDIFREELFDQPYKFNSYNENRITRYATARLLYHIEYNESIIVDNTHCNEKDIDKLINWMSDHAPQYEIQVKFFDIPLYKAYYRNIIRCYQTDKWIPFKAIKRMYNNYQKINKEKYKQYE